jgi:hypothetical protein
MQKRNFAELRRIPFRGSMRASRQEIAHRDHLSGGAKVQKRTLCVTY